MLLPINMPVMCVCVVVQFVNELLFISMNTVGRGLRSRTNKGLCPVLKASCADEETEEVRKVCTPRSKSLCRKAKVCIPRSLRRQTNKGKCVSLVLKACADEQTGEVCVARCKSFLRADLHGTVFVACILKHVLKCWYKNRTV